MIIEELTGYKRGEQVKVKLNSISSIDEILSSPFFFRFRKMVDNIKWEAVTQGTAQKSYKVQNTLGRKLKMVLKAPEDFKYKRAWHFWKLFPKKELEYCCNRAMEEALGIGSFVPFDAEAFFAA